MRSTTYRLLLPVLAAGAVPASADPPPFELAGPDLRVEVTRGDRTLPISRVPTLAAGDRLTIHGAYSQDQDVKFLIVSAFLRGATNPPPKDWIATAQTWKAKEKDRALRLTVPEGARQLVLLTVPETGGAEGVLVDAVRGKPGEFVRAGQDLNQASLDHARLLAFMGAIRAQADAGPEHLRTVAPLLAGSLSIKLQADCLSRVIEQQASCLVENRDALVLGDVQSRSLAATLSGAPTDLALQLSNTREGGAGYYSAYIGVARDVARIFGAFNNPQFNYLPTLTTRSDDRLSLLLNAAPSFQKPKSVMVTALPAIDADAPPPLRSIAKGPICAGAAGTLLPVEGAPLVFATEFAHGMQARLTSASGQVLDVPISARADKGGYVLDGGGLPVTLAGPITAHIHGRWGFAAFEGPDFLLERPGPQGWKAMGDPDALIVGRDNEVILEGFAPSCVESVSMRQGNGPARALEWRARDGGRLTVTVPLADAAAGDLRIEVRQAGAASGQIVTLAARVQASRLETLQIHAGDRQATLTGQRLDQVRAVMVGDLELRPDGVAREGMQDRLRLLAQAEGRAPAAGTVAKATVKLADGRSLSIPVVVSPPRPQAALIGRTVYPGAPPPGGRALDLGQGDLLPDSGEIVFSVKAEAGGRFGAGDAVEIAPEQGDTVSRLSAGKGMALESAQVIVATLRAADLPPATFGPLRFRLVRQEPGGRDEAGDWQPLTTAVRLPRIDGVSCGEGAMCTITGRNLFLLDAVAADAGFSRAVNVPIGFTGGTVSAPRPADGILHLRLRDAPRGVVTLKAW